jgi:hypothetical protein
MKYILPILLICFTTVLSCKKLDKLTQFDLTYTSEATISAGIASNLPFDVFTPDVTTQSESEFKGHNTAKNLVQSIKLKKMQLLVINPADRNLDFLKDIELYISAEGEKEMRIAWKYNIPDTTGKEILLETGLEELKPYLIKEKYRIRLKVTTSKIMNTDITVKLVSTFRVNANIMGI